MCVCVCVCGKKELSVCGKEKKGGTNLIFQREGSTRQGEGKKSSKGKFLNLKVLKLWLLLGKVPSHF